MALEIRPADKLKVIVIEYLISKYPGVIIGNEIMYGTTRKVVDLLALYNGETFAIEIKSEKDNMNRLLSQLKEYSLIFDHTFVFLDSKHVNSVLSLKFPKLSIFEITDNKVNVIKISDEINRTTKQEMLYSVSSSYIKKFFQLPKNLNSDLIRKKVMKDYNKNIIHSLLYTFLEEKLKENFKLLMKVGKYKITVDDLIVLSSRLNL